LKLASALALMVCAASAHGCVYDWELPSGGAGSPQIGGSGGTNGAGGGVSGGGGAEPSLLDPATLQPIAVGGTHGCATLDGTHLQCWGSNLQGQLGSPSSGFLVEPERPWQDPESQNQKVIVKIVAGDRHSCVLIETGEIYCWGDNSQGQLGLGTEVAEATEPILVNLTPTCSPQQVLASDIAAGAEHTCASTGNQVFCWGSNEFAQVGVEGGLDDVFVPTLKSFADGAHDFALAAGSAHTCVRYAFGGPAVVCWGANDSAQLGTGEIGPPSSKAVPVAYVFQECSVIAAGLGDHTCCVDGGAVVCWGSNAQGRADFGSDAPIVDPRAVPLSFDRGTKEEPLPLLLWLGSEGTCARGQLTPEQSPSTQCWGKNVNHLMSLSANDPLKPAGDVGWTQYEYVAFSKHACGLSVDSVECWGNNDAGQVVSPGAPGEWLDQTERVFVISP